MADWYDKTLSKIGKGLIDLNSLSNPKIVPVTSGYVFNQAHEFYSDITPAERVATEVAMTNVVFGPAAGTCYASSIACANFAAITTTDVKWSQDQNEANDDLMYPNTPLIGTPLSGIETDASIAALGSPVAQMVSFANEIDTIDNFGIFLVLENGELWMASAEIANAFGCQGVGATPVVRTLTQCIYSDDSLVSDCVKIGVNSYSKTSFFINTSGDCYGTGLDLNSWINFANTSKFLQIWTSATNEAADIAVASGSQFNVWLAVKNRSTGVYADLLFIGDAALGQRGDASVTYVYNAFISITGFAPERLKEVAGGIYGIVGTAVWYAGSNTITPYVGGGTTDNVNVGTFAQVETMDAAVETDLSVQIDLGHTTAYDYRGSVKCHVIIDSAGGVYTPAATWVKEAYTLKGISVARTYAIHANFDGSFSWEGSQDDIIEAGSTTSTGIETLPAAWGINACSTSGKDGWLDADDPTILAPTVGDMIQAFVMINDTGLEATSPVLLYSDSSPGLPYLVETTGAITVQLGPDGIAKL